jgi:hypothetical protein
MVNQTSMIFILNSFYYCVLRDEMNKIKFHLHSFLEFLN